MTVYPLIGDSHRDIAAVADDRSASPRSRPDAISTFSQAIFEKEPRKRPAWLRYLTQLLRWWPDE